MPLSDLTANAIDLLEPQRQCTGQLTLNLSTIGIDSTVIQLAMKGFPMPKRIVNKIQVPHLNENRFFAGKPAYDDMTLTFTDFIDNDVAGAIEKWWVRVVNSKTGKIGWARQYKVGATATQYGPNGQYDRNWTLQGCFPTSFDPGDMDNGSDDAVQVTLVISVDKAYLAERVPSSDYSTT